MSTAVIMMTHLFDKPVLDEFQRMREGLGATDRAFLLCDGSALRPAAVSPWVHAFDYKKISRRAARLIGDDILRNTHLPWIDFFEAHPGFDFYWIIEYDVRYAGPWIELFGAFRDLPFDLLCTHLRTFDHEPWWPWWSEIHSPVSTLSVDRLLRGFLPVTRLSRQAFTRLRDAVDEGWVGFLEGLIPTLLHTSGFRLADIGGDGPFVPPEFKNRFYTSYSDRGGSLLGMGTMRYRPAIPFPRILPGRLYHPVKEEAPSFDAEVGKPGRVCTAIECAFDTVRGQQPPAREPSIAVNLHTEYLLQVCTGIGSAEIREALRRVEAAGEKDLTIEQLRRNLSDLCRIAGAPLSNQ